MKLVQTVHGVLRPLPAMRCLSLAEMRTLSIGLQIPVAHGRIPVAGVVAGFRLLVITLLLSRTQTCGFLAAPHVRSNL